MEVLLTAVLFHNSTIGKETYICLYVNLLDQLAAAGPQPALDAETTMNAPGERVSHLSLNTFDPRGPVVTVYQTMASNMYLSCYPQCKGLFRQENFMLSIICFYMLLLCLSLVYDDYRKL